MRKSCILLLLLMPLYTFAVESVEQWDFFEITLSGPETGNPFTEVNLAAEFSSEDTSFTVSGFYNGCGEYKIRFMPQETGLWNYQTKSNASDLNGKQGTVKCISAKENNHGPVHVAKQFHFDYADGTPYYPFGTTCYAWFSQPDSLQEVTLQTLSTAPFNKIRMCVFPKTMDFLEFNEPPLYAYEGTPPRNWDLTRFNPVFFEKLETRILQLRDLGIECDLIIFHPYDFGRWGFDCMPDDADDLYLRYLIARLSVFRNVWWSVANEFDQLKTKEIADWDRFFQILVKEDPYQHLRSIHNCHSWYDHTKSWVTHASIQEFANGTRGWIEKYQKPVIVDECRYEGNMKFTWSDLTPESMTLQFWDAVTMGGYASHGETYLHPSGVIWWGHGGVLHGQSVERIRFLRNIVESMPRNGLVSFNGSPVKWNRLNSVRLDDECFLFYFRDRQHGERDIELPEDKQYKIEIIDTWAMTITEVEGTFQGITTVKLPTKPYIALRVTAVK